MDGETQEVCNPCGDREVSRMKDGPSLVQNIQINGGTHHSAGRDMNNYNIQNIHHHYPVAPKITSIPALDPIGNFRATQQDTLSRRTEKTGEWIFKYEQFPVWQDPKSSLNVIWGSGIAGAGKTVLTSTVIDFFEKRAKERAQSISVGYIYIRYSDNSDLTVRQCLEVLVKQTIEMHPACLEMAEKLYAEHTRLKTRPTESELVQLLRRFRATVDCAYYFLEALDEAPAHLQYDLVKALSSLDGKLFITSRHLQLVQAQFLEAHRFEITPQDRDIELHIHKEIERSPSLHRLLQDMTLSDREDIVKSIKDKCGGMFLHAALQMADLRECTSLHGVRKILSSFPSKIEEVYEHTWQRIGEQHQERALEARTCLSWVVGAARSMSVEELCHAAATSLETHEFDQTRLVPIDILVGSCRGLLVVDEEIKLVRLVHFTAKDTLKRLILESCPRLHCLLTSFCISQLTKHGFHSWHMGSELDVLNKALKSACLLSYAHGSWPFHARNSLHDAAAVTAVRSFVKGCRAFPVQRVWDVEVLDHPLHIVVHLELPLYLASSMSITLPSPNVVCGGKTPLHRACEQRSTQLVEQLLSLSRIDVHAVDSDGRTPMFIAASNGDEAIFKLLFQHPQARVKRTVGPYLKTFWRSSGEFTRSILFHAAARGGNIEIVKALLAASEMVGALDPMGRTPLSIASGWGNVAVVELLLAASQAETGIADGRGRTPLSYASEGGYDGIVKLLLAASQAEIGVADKWMGRTPLSRASEKGHDGIVKLLLAASPAEIGIADKGGRTPLHYAIQTRNSQAPAVIKLLLAASRAELAIADNDGFTPLMRASQRGREEAVRILLEHPLPDASLADAISLKALTLAERGGHAGVANLIRAHRRTST